MNLRQKRKHYNYSYRYFIAWIVVDDKVSFAVCPKKFKKTLKQKLKVNKTYDVNPAWLVGWIDDEMMPGVQVVEKVVYKESPTARLPDYFNNNNEGKIIKWKQSRRYRGGRN